MKTFTFIFTILIAITSPAAPTEIILSLGESTSLPLNPRSSVWIQDRALLKAEAIGSRLQLKGVSEGLTNARIDEKLYRIQVLHPAKRAAFSDLRRHLSKFVGLNVEVGDGDLLVTGRLYRMQDWIRLGESLKSSGASYQMRAVLSPALQNESQRYFNDLLVKAKIPPQSVVFIPSPEIRAAGSDTLIKKYEKLFRPFGITVIKDQSSIDIAPTVKVQITVAEVKRSSHLNFGVRWPDSFKATVLGNGDIDFANAEFFASAFEKDGHGKILASPNIICRSGNEAEFLAGGEFPIKIMNYKIQDIVWKRYGILLRVRPRADSSGRISLSLETEISTMDEATGVDGVPGILTNRVSSHFDLTRPQTIALSGLLKNIDSKTSNGIPGLSKLPILGALFSSKDYKEDRSELVIFVRPTIMNENENIDSSPQHVGRIQNEQ
ncbi:pilus assembly protein [Bdellovibrio sp. HCB290]|uniref:pilus assembly protein n=1 Tax=Bdellovibrio sp. HCB290 TaxID=3394356 RepID=UPI0039B5CA87